MTDANLKHRLNTWVFLLMTTLSTAGHTAQTVSSERLELRLEQIADGLEHPWGMAFLGDGRILVTERTGRLRMVDSNGLVAEPVSGTPRAAVHGQGGLLDVALHPEFATNDLVYLSYVGQSSDGLGTEVARGRLNGSTLEGLEVIFRMQPKSNGGRHFGSRLIFDPQGRLYITLGDRGDKNRAQRLDDHAGSVIRINADGSIPADNPFVSRKDARPDIFSFGHRNQQGAALNPQSGELWTHEHGPQGGDEVNVVRAGVNHGWPVITYGVNYVIGTSIGEGTHKSGMAQPLHYWVPSIAPSGMAFYAGERIPEWRGNLLVGSLKFATLVRLEVDGEKIIHEERLLQNEIGRIRDVRQGPDGLIYLLTDASNGGLYRLSPAR